MASVSGSRQSTPSMTNLMTMTETTNEANLNTDQQKKHGTEMGFHCMFCQEMILIACCGKSGGHFVVVKTDPSEDEMDEISNSYSISDIMEHHSYFKRPETSTEMIIDDARSRLTPGDENVLIDSETGRQTCPGSLQHEEMIIVSATIENDRNLNANHRTLNHQDESMSNRKADLNNPSPNKPFKRILHGRILKNAYEEKDSRISQTENTSERLGGGLDLEVVIDTAAEERPFEYPNLDFVNDHSEEDDDDVSQTDEDSGSCREERGEKETFELLAEHMNKDANKGADKISGPQTFQKVDLTFPGQKSNTETKKKVTCSKNKGTTVKSILTKNKPGPLSTKRRHRLSKGLSLSKTHQFVGVIELKECSVVLEDIFGQHACLVCCRRFKKAQELEDHLQNHFRYDLKLKNLPEGVDWKTVIAQDNEKRRYFCELCGSRFKRSNHLIKHRQRLHEKKFKFGCLICGLWFNAPIQLQKHMSTAHWQDKSSKPVHVKRTYSCETCGMSYSLLSSLEKHMEFHIEEHTQCTQCGKVCMTRGELNFHSKMHELEEKAFNNTFMKRKANTDVKTDNTVVRTADTVLSCNVHECHLCGYMAQGPGKLDRHIYSAHCLKMKKKAKTVVKPVKTRYICQTCGVSFGLQDALVKHMEFHIEEHSQCKKCGKVSLSRGESNEHKKVHTFIENSMRTVDSCAKCGKNFYSTTKMKYNDMNTHSGKPELEKIAKAYCSKCRNLFLNARLCCDKCGKCFKHEANFREHLKRHEKTTVLGVKYFCGKCDKSFLKQSVLEAHMKTHELEQGPDICCDKCGRCFKTRDTLRRHLKRHEKNPLLGAKYVCEKCDQSFLKHSALESHMRSHGVQSQSEQTKIPPEPEKSPPEPEKNWICICKEAFVSENQLRSHLSISHGLTQGYPCIKCVKSFPDLFKLRRHLHEVHGQKVPNTCDVCNKVFRESERLRIHKLKDHEGKKPFVCEICGNGFASITSLNFHQTNHSENRPRPYACKVCDKRFFSKRYLKTHAVIHSEVCQFSCDQCGRSFKTKDRLKSHFKFVHTSAKRSFGKYKNKYNNAKRGFPCEICGKVLSTYSSLYTHKVVHSKEKPFVCTKCGKAFARQLSLRTHLLIHSNEKPYKCHFCPAKFKVTSNRSRHEKIHKGAPSIKCESCDQFFRMKDAYQAHCKTKKHLAKVAEMAGKSVGVEGKEHVSTAQVDMTEADQPIVMETSSPAPLTVLITLAPHTDC